MRVRLEDIPEEGLEISLGAGDARFAPMLRELTEGEALPPLSGALQFKRVEGAPAVFVTGAVQTTVEAACNRCLDLTTVRIDEPVQLLLQEEGAEAEEGGADEDREEEDLDVAWFDPADGIDVGELVREQLLLGMPSTVLCRPDCKGICQQCGADLNREPCTCGEQPKDPRFALLASLKRPN